MTEKIKFYCEKCLMHVELERFWSEYPEKKPIQFCPCCKTKLGFVQRYDENEEEWL